MYITKKKDIQAITTDGKLYPIEKDRGAISHPLSLPSWIREGLKEGKVFEGEYKAFQIGETRKGNPKYHVSFSGKMIPRPKSFWIEEEGAKFYENSSFLRTLVKEYYEINLVTKERRKKNEVIEFSKAPLDVQTKLYENRMKRIRKYLSLRREGYYEERIKQEENIKVEFQRYGGFGWSYVYSPKIVKISTPAYYFRTYAKYKRFRVETPLSRLLKEKKHDVFNVEISEPFGHREVSVENQTEEYHSSSDGYRMDTVSYGTSYERKIQYQQVMKVSVKKEYLHLFKGLDTEWEQTRFFYETK